MSNERISPRLLSALFLLIVAIAAIYGFWNEKSITLSSEEGDRTIEETGKPEASTDPHWWLNSGAYLYITGNVARNVHGTLPENDPWRTRYQASNATDTEHGARPQNIFRLISKRSWENASQVAYFKIIAENKTESPRQSPSNGIFFYQHFKDRNNTYYVGIRLNGHIIIYKKAAGVYHTLAIVPFFVRPSLTKKVESILPHNQWIGLRSDIIRQDDGVHISLFIDPGETGTWIQSLEVVDSGELGGPPITEGHAGIRSDFLDLEIKDYRVTER